MSTGFRLVRTLWTDAGERLLRRLDGLSEEEFFWEPADGCWTVRRDQEAPSGWQIDYDFPFPTPPPLTTIAWRLVHLANGNWIRWEHAFGPALRMFPDLLVPGSAAEARSYWQDSRDPITTWLAAATDADMDRTTTTPYGEPIAAGDTVRILLEEEIHHGAEIGVLRDLHARLPR